MTQETTEDTKPNLRRRLVVAATVTGIGAAAIANIVANHGKYGYDPSHNPAPPTYMDRHPGLNPADIKPGDS